MGRSKFDKVATLAVEQWHIGQKRESPRGWGCCCTLQWGLAPAAQTLLCTNPPHVHSTTILCFLLCMNWRTHRHTHRPNTTLSPGAGNGAELGSRARHVSLASLSPPPACLLPQSTKIPPNLTKQKYKSEIMFHSKGCRKHSCMEKSLGWT